MLIIVELRNGYTGALYASLLFLNMFEISIVKSWLEVTHFFT